ncbi:MAG: glycosyltransferase family 1 protein, partial [Candidatus Taylorbacteria bacterium]|nr:glycosyltransferase family 1 protein [Candidatus Taylorbacteria bacterium]
MKILIDGHMLGSNEGGNERYTKNLILSLSKIAPIGVLLYKKLRFVKKIYSHIIINNDFIRLLIAPIIMIINGYDVLHVNYLLPFWKPLRIKYVLTVHDLYFKRSPNSYSYKDKFIFYVLFPYSLWLCDAIIVPSNFSRSELIHFYPQYTNKVFVTYYGVDPVFRKINRRISSIPYFLAIASKSERKNIRTICNAFIEARMENTHLYIIGIKPQDTAIPRNHNIHFLGYVPDSRLNMLYHEARALIYASSYEGFGLPPLEALACDTQVIASDTPCMREIGGHMYSYYQKGKL